MVNKEGASRQPAVSLPNTKEGITLTTSYPDSTSLNKLAARCLLAPSFPTGGSASLETAFSIADAG